ncbi:hypothetical protein PBCV1_A486L [Paramecium bursaria Chlorella virus 1]|uniref:Uncharacterized protein n=1 Tax=Paramecium bursaria Chlorella virus 1 TaxID=10506 RepID=Q98536_PBCV1|nr:hypothetical protein PBCV1_A486L [Paramecium bursaria Chlorella virus 1]AAC96853.1 hypothetical protein [Paramecium bursaria Chlorella virus 1]
MVYIETYPAIEGEDNKPFYISKIEHDMMMSLRSFYETHFDGAFLWNSACDWNGDYDDLDYGVETLFKNGDMVGLERDNDGFSFSLRFRNMLVTVFNDVVRIEHDGEHVAVQFEYNDENGDETDEIISKFATLVKSFPTEFDDSEKIMWLKPV